MTTITYRFKFEDDTEETVKASSFSEAMHIVDDLVFQKKSLVKGYTKVKANA